jgi:hypothetical protein
MKTFCKPRLTKGKWAMPGAFVSLAHKAVRHTDNDGNEFSFNSFFSGLSG